MKQEIFKIKREKCFVIFKTPENKYATLLIYALVLEIRNTNCDASSATMMEVADE